MEPDNQHDGLEGDEHTLGLLGRVDQDQHAEQRLEDDQRVHAQQTVLALEVRRVSLPQVVEPVFLGDRQLLVALRKITRRCKGRE